MVSVYLQLIVRSECENELHLTVVDFLKRPFFEQKKVYLGKLSTIFYTTKKSTFLLVNTHLPRFLAK